LRGECRECWVKFVPRGRLRFDRQESAGPNMQRKLLQTNAAVLKPLNKALREMQAGSRRGDGALFACKKRLVVGPVFLVWLAPGGDIRWQRHITAFADRLVQDRAMKGE